MVARRQMVWVAIGLATGGAFALVVLRARHGVVSAATSPDWTLLAGAFAVGAAVQPLRALAWRTTLREPGLDFRSLYAASAVGSFLDTVLPGRLGEASKVGVLRVTSGARWPGLSRAGGSLLAAHLLEAIAFAAVGACSALFLPFPGWARGTLLAGLGLAAGVIALAAVLHHKIGRHLPRPVDRFLAGAAAPPGTLGRAGGILLLTWTVRWGGTLLLLQAFGVGAGAGAALVYMIVTGLANTAPLLPGNAGVYQGAAVGALALSGYGGATAVAVSLAAPIVGSVGTAVAAAIGIALCGSRVGDIRRAALARA
jgi:uncharacterized membrane protein YbhN (UPF0104 family)